jgi:EmrB/QacA subfamily drug resistance transporter
MKGRSLVLGAAILAIAMAAVEGTIVATAMPTIVAQLGGLRWFSWVFAAYFLTQALTIPIYGRLADAYGRKRVFLAGTAVFLIGSILCGFSRAMPVLIAFRALQGIGAGAVQPIATTIVGDVCSGAERARAQGYISAAWGVSALVGPLLGALLVQQWTWATVFWINVPIGVACMLVLARYLHEDLPSHPHRIDYLGSALLALGLGPLMLALVMSDSLAPGTLLGVAAFSAIVLAVLVVHERRAPEPVVPLGLWRFPTIAVANGANFGIGMITMGVTAFLPTYIQGVMAKTALDAGVALAGMSVSWTLASIVMGRLLSRTTYRRGALAGGIVGVAGAASLALLHPSQGALWATFGACILGTGIGLGNNVFIVSTQSSVGWEQRGVATASNLFMRQVGQAVGTSLFGAVFNASVFRAVPNASDAVGALMQPALRARLPAPEVGRLTAVVAHALHDVYLLVALVAVAILALVFRLPAGLTLTTAPNERSAASS